MHEAATVPVDMRWVESFGVVAEELHFTRAAQRLNVSQPALSQQIARLERQLGVQLFVRSPGSVSLTDAGAALWREAQPALAALQVGFAAARAVGRDVRRLRVQHLSSYGPQVMPQVAAHLRGIDPQLTVELREASVEEQLDALRRRTADVAVFHLDPDVELSTVDITTTVLTTAPRFMAVPLGHPLAAATTLPLADFAGEVWIMPVGSIEQSVQEQNVLAACRRRGFQPRVGQRANSIETILGLVASGFGVAPAPWSVALRPPPSVHLARLDDERHLLIVAHRSDAESTDSAASFVAAARLVMENMLAAIP